MVYGFLLPSKANTTTWKIDFIFYFKMSTLKVIAALGPPICEMAYHNAYFIYVNNVTVKRITASNEVLQHAITLNRRYY